MGNLILKLKGLASLKSAEPFGFAKIFCKPKKAARYGLAGSSGAEDLPENLRGKVFEADSSEIDDPVLSVAKNVFGVSHLYPWQRLVVGNILDASADPSCHSRAPTRESFERQIAASSAAMTQDGGDSTDIFCMGRQIVLLPTGAGKSMCFLLPAVMLPGPTLIFYPLLALMADQKRRLEQNGIECVVFRGGQSEDEREENFRRLSAGAKIILANPEVLQSERLLERFKACKISHVAIDEAHCVAEWGDTFRPAYLTLGKIIQALGVPLVTAFTATASPTVLERVSQVLFGGRVHIVRGQSDRPNIHYSVHYAWAKKKAVCRLAATEKKPMLVFCGTRAKSEDMARELCECVGSDKVRFYHAGLSREEKTAVEKWFFPKKDAILCCTCAFGMGVDKADIRTVVHLEASPTAESYIQEAGRGGRDKKLSKAILLWSREDSEAFEKFPKKSREYVLKKFAEAKNCRRQVLLSALGGEEAICSGCDICDAQKAARQRGALEDWKAPSVFDAADARLVHKFIRKNQNYYGREQVVERTMKKFNEMDKKIFGVNVWDSSDIDLILDQLEKSGSVYNAGVLWEGALAAEKEISTSRRRHPLCLHPRPLSSRLPFLGERL
ncbi:MAG: ATP-dependent DNA helicase RecQ [Treponema sp.]|nr:ATP-dependent DNA helicase RecQ [Treponema sp.]